MEFTAADIVDVCAGRARVTCWARHAQLQAVAIDRAYGEHLDICTEEGFAIVILLVLRIKENGLMMAAPNAAVGSGSTNTFTNASVTTSLVTRAFRLWLRATC